MPKFENGRRATAFATLIAGAATALVGSQMVLSLAFSGPNVGSADTFNVVDEHKFQALPAPALAVGSTGLMNAATSTGQFEDLVKPSPVPTVAPTAIPAQQPTPAPTATAQPNVFEAGIASTYGEGDGFEGNLTACGQVFHTKVVQLAHKSLPCGTTVRVEDTDTGRSVVAEVTDRGPYVAGRIVDLSWGAFQQLDPSGPGLLHVKVYVLD